MMGMESKRDENDRIVRAMRREDWEELTYVPDESLWSIDQIFVQMVEQTSFSERCGYDGYQEVQQRLLYADVGSGQRRAQLVGIVLWDRRGTRRGLRVSRGS